MSLTFKRKNIIQSDVQITIFVIFDINYFDTSYAYNEETSEGSLKKALVERYPRESYQIANKIPSWLLRDEKDNDRLVDVMLERLGINSISIRPVLRTIFLNYLDSRGRGFLLQ